MTPTLRSQEHQLANVTDLAHLCPLILGFLLTFKPEYISDTEGW